MKKIFNNIKKRYNDKTNIIHDLLVIIMLVLSFIFPWLLIVLVIVMFVVLIMFLIFNNRFIKEAQGNGVIYGGRGKGKGLLLNFLIRKDRTKPFCNVEYKGAELLDDPSEYLESITPNTIENFINNEVVNVNKIEKFEGRNVYLDDVNVYMPNWADNLLKKHYESMPPMLAINRHLYNAHMVITTQDRERPYKILKELQTDFNIKAVKTRGFGFIWQCIPFLRYFVYTKYIYHENAKAVDMLPFNSKAMINETIKHGYLTSGQATKETYEATNGIIRYGRVLQLKKHLGYDTRFFHQVVYGYKADNN